MGDAYSAGAQIAARSEVRGSCSSFARRWRSRVGRPTESQDVSLLTSAPEGEARYRDGVLGIDALRAGFTLDFRAMQFRLE